MNRKYESKIARRSPMRFTYTPAGVCSTRIDLEIEQGVVRHCAFTDGCEGNLSAVSSLVVGRTPEELIPMLEKITCDGHTSCPAQLAMALRRFSEPSPGRDSR
jgi:uncharacterized protein (TIGR03905 family)